jgi:hypothetical protein
MTKHLCRNKSHLRPCLVPPSICFFVAEIGQCRHSVRLADSIVQLTKTCHAKESKIAFSHSVELYHNRLGDPLRLPIPPHLCRRLHQPSVVGINGVYVGDGGNITAQASSSKPDMLCGLCSIDSEYENCFLPFCGALPQPSGGSPAATYTASSLSARSGWPIRLYSSRRPAMLRNLGNGGSCSSFKGPRACIYTNVIYRTLEVHQVMTTDHDTHNDTCHHDQTSLRCRNRPMSAFGQVGRSDCTAHEDLPC